MTSYWFLLECSVFVLIQALVFVYEEILKTNSYKIRKHLMRVEYMMKSHVPDYRGHRAVYINFNRWRTLSFEIVDSILQLGALYLPILVVLFIAAAS